MSKPIRKRSEVAAEFTWDLTDIFPSDEAWRAEYEALKPYAEAVAAYQGRLGESAETLLAYFRLDDELNVRVGRLYGYANCKADEDTSNGFYQDLRGKALSLSVTLSGAGATLTVALYVYANERGETAVAFSIATILMLLTLLINLSAVFLGRKLKKN